jgi:hypothetical protein
MRNIMSDQQKEGQLNIEISEEVADGEYSNFAILTHSNAEFVIDFIKIVPGAPKAKVKSRIIMTPQHAKRLMRALGDNIDKYEQSFGEIEDHGKGQPSIPMNFGGPTTQA